MEGEHESNYSLQIQEISPEETEELLSFYNHDTFTNFIRIGPYFFNKEYEMIASDIYNLPLRSNDTFVVTVPRSGSTWTQELVWLLQNNLDFETAKATPLTCRFPFLESTAFGSFQNSQKILPVLNATREKFFVDLEAIKTLPSPRFIKSHSPLSLLPPNLLETAKVVYVARDPRDVAMSYFYHFQSLNLIKIDKPFKPFWNLFLEDKVLWTPFFCHLKEAYLKRNHPNMSFIFYEELFEDLPEVSRRLAKFFGKKYTDEQFEALCEHLKFDNFKNNEALNRAGLKKIGLISGDFMRKGIAGGWRDHFDEDMTQQAERWIADNLRDTDLRFLVKKLNNADL